MVTTMAQAGLIVFFLILSFVSLVSPLGFKVAQIEKSKTE